MKTVSKIIAVLGTIIVFIGIIVGFYALAAFVIVKIIKAAWS